MKDSVIYYSVGALLYCPANNEGIVESLITERFGKQFSLALCLEDTINDNKIKEAEDILLHSLHSLYQESLTKHFYLPKIFIRVRYPKQISELVERMGEEFNIISGFIAPKFSLENVDEYISTIKNINVTASHKIYLMPILENSIMINLLNRHEFLHTLKNKLDTIEEYVLNIRVGGNDLSHAFGLRRHVNETIHGILPLHSIFTDILTVFSMDYVVSGPVWEYYSGPDWDKGLKNELALDLLSGFVGKTVIHPNQIPVVNEALQVFQADYEDAKSILNWDSDSNSFVSGSVTKERMNEYKTHSNWALKTIFLAEYYGTK